MQTARPASGGEAGPQKGDALGGLPEAGPAGRLGVPGKPTQLKAREREPRAGSASSSMHSWPLIDTAQSHS